MWLKIQNGKVTASLPKGFVGMQHRHIATDEAARWEEYNMAALGGQPLAERNVLMKRKSLFLMKGCFD